MAQTDPIKLSGTVLKTQLAWLAERAVQNPDGQLSCKACGQALLSRTHHRYRMNAAGSEASFVLDKDLPGTTGPAEMKSFTGFICVSCGDAPAVPDSVHERELVFFRNL